MAASAVFVAIIVLWIRWTYFAPAYWYSPRMGPILACLLTAAILAGFGASLLRSKVLRIGLQVFAGAALVALVITPIPKGWSSRPQYVNGNSGLELSQSETTYLTDKAAKGDGSAAWRLYICYVFTRPYPPTVDMWLCRAAALGNSNGELELARAIKERHHSPEAFGTTGPEAFRKLLEHASLNNGQACYDLASACCENYLGAPDLTKARFYFERGSELGDRMCWAKYSQLCHQAVGGDRDESSAYYWISLETRCVDPRSIGGKKAWSFRNEVADTLPIEELRRQWMRIDEYISRVRAGKVFVFFVPFGKGEIKSELSDEGLKLSDEAEAQHRQRMELREREAKGGNT
jgi:hypothetical protein